MIRVAIYEPASGRIARIVQGPADQVMLQAGPGECMIEVPADVTDASHNVLGGALVPKPPPVIDHWAAVRAERNARLKATDWMVLRELEQGIPMSPGVRAYRQALRDVTLQADPLAITWPTPP